VRALLIDFSKLMANPMTVKSLGGLPPEDKDRIMEEAAEFIPARVTAIAAY
jgi:hypothetical protein